MALCPLLILLSTLALANGKPILLATVGGSDSNAVDVVAIDPTNGNVSKLYQLPRLPSLSGLDVCMKIDSKRNLIHILISNDLLTATYLYELSLSDGHLIATFNLSNNFELFTQWDYDPATSTLYGLCLNQSTSTLFWNYTWCHIELDENGLGKTQHGFFVSGDDDPPGAGFCDRVSMNRNTFATGEYWYSLSTNLFVRHVSSPTGEPGKILWAVQDKDYIDAMEFAALVTGKTNEYAIVVRAPLVGHENDGMAVVKLDSSGNEKIIAKLPKTLTTDGPGGVVWDYDPVDEVLYLLMQSKPNYICDTLVKVNLTQTNSHEFSSCHTTPVPLNLLFDPQSYSVHEVHLIEWPPTTGP